MMQKNVQFRMETAVIGWSPQKKDSDSDIAFLCSIHGLLNFHSAQEIVGQRPRDHEADRSCEASQTQHAN